MRRRIASALALWALAGLAGCATRTPRSEVPLQFRGDWTPPAAKAPAGPISGLFARATGNTPSNPAPPGPISAFFARSVTSATGNAPSNAAPSGPIASFLARSAGSTSPNAPASPAPSGPIASLLARSASSTSSNAASSPAPADTATAKVAATPGTGTQANAKPAPGSEIPATSVRPHYRPGSWFFRRLAKPATRPATTPPSDPSGSLARYFPTLYGKGVADPGRVARASRPTGGDRAPTLAASSIVMTRNTIGSDPIEPPLLTDGIVVRAYPKAPSPSLPPQEAVARDDHPGPTERLTSHEADPAAPEASPRPKRDLIDALSTHLDVEPSSVPSRPDPDDAPTDPAGRPTSATVEVPAAAPPTDKPAGALVASPGPEAEPTPAAVIAPNIGTDLISTLLAPPTQTPAASVEQPPTAAAAVEPTPAPPEPARPAVGPQVVPAAPPAVANRPRRVRAESIDLPEPEFPATYHTESLRRVAREAPQTGPTREIAIERSAYKPILPRLSRMLWGHDEPKDRPSARPEPGDVAERR